MNGKLLQRCFVNLVYSMLNENMKKKTAKFKTQTEFAKAAFYEDSNPTKTWQSIRLGQKGKARGVTIEEASNMAQAMDDTLDRFLVKAEMLIETGWTIEQDIFNLPHAKLAGRPSKQFTPKEETIYTNSKPAKQIPVSGNEATNEHKTIE